MEREKIAELAAALFDSERGRASIAPLTDANPDMTVEDAYAIQLENIQRATGLGYKVSGKKIGLTSEGMQSQFGVDQPDYGHLFAEMDCPSGDVKTDELISPKIEAEIAFVLKEGLTGGKVTREDVLAATDFVCGAFEIVDSRIEGWKIKLPDTIADNASTGRYVLGAIRVSPYDIDLPGEAMQLYKNGEFVSEGYGSAVIGDPAKSVAWLANCLYGYGVDFKAGEVILSGGITAAPVAAKGDVFEARFPNLGTVVARFV